MYSGQIFEFWASKDGTAFQKIASANLHSTGDASAAWTPIEGGSYQVAASINDILSSNLSLPLPGVTNQLTINVTNGPDSISACEHHQAAKGGEDRPPIDWLRAVNASKKSTRVVLCADKARERLPPHGDIIIGSTISIAKPGFSIRVNDIDIGKKFIIIEWQSGVFSRDL
jgi:hypothetical protein